MPKTIIQKLKQNIQKIQLKRQGVVISHSCAFANIEFRGTAKIEPYCRFFGEPKIQFGERFYMNANCHILGEVYFGNDVMIGPKTIIWGRDHGMETETPMNTQAHISAPIKVADDVWIGANVTILKGVSIGKGAVIGAGSVITKDIPALAIAVGNPAKVVKYRK